MGANAHLGHWMVKIITLSVVEQGLKYTDFRSLSSKESEMCQYFENFLISTKSIKDLIRADRQADFLLHIEATKNLLPLFTGGDWFNYQRWI